VIKNTTFPLVYSNSTTLCALITRPPAVGVVWAWD